MDFVASGKDPETMDKTEICTTEARGLKPKYDRARGKEKLGRGTRNETFWTLTVE